LKPIHENPDGSEDMFLKKFRFQIIVTGETI